MLSVIQRVKHAQVEVDEVLVGRIERGILALVGIEKTDSEQDAEALFHKIVQYRIFPDDQDRMNLSLINTAGALLLVPQFTLVADTLKGTRPGFSKGMPPEEGKILFEYLVNYAKKQELKVEQGIFGANMQISLCNEGPVTFIIKTR